MKLHLRTRLSLIGLFIDLALTSLWNPVPGARVVRIVLKHYRQTCIRRAANRQLF